jgi:chaperonin cofactor prefoldin
MAYTVRVSLLAILLSVPLAASLGSRASNHSLEDTVETLVHSVGYLNQQMVDRDHVIQTLRTDLGTRDLDIQTLRTDNQQLHHLVASLQSQIRELHFTPNCW